MVRNCEVMHNDGLMNYGIYQLFMLMGPKLFWTVQINLVEYHSFWFWSDPNYKNQFIKV